MGIRNYAGLIMNVIRTNRLYRQNKAAKQYNLTHHCPALTHKERKEIDLYWAQYHVKFEDYEWFKMYYAVTGLCDPRFIPHPFAERVLYLFYNRQDFSSAYADKNMFSTFLPQMAFPISIGKRVNSHYYDADGVYLGGGITDQLIDAIYASLERRGGKDVDHDIIIKETIGSRSGLSVCKKHINTKEDLKEAMTHYQSDNYIIQLAVQQHPFFSQFNEESVNIIRLTTWRTGNEVYVFSPCIRFGIKGSYTDISFKNGKEILNVVKIECDGSIANHYITLDGEKIPLPDNYNKRVPLWNKIVECVKISALELPYFDIVGWDITVDVNEQVVCIEYNLKWPGTIVYQFAHGPLAGEKTDDLLSFLKDKNNIKWIPKCIRKE